MFGTTTLLFQKRSVRGKFLYRQNLKRKKGKRQACQIIAFIVRNEPKQLLVLLLMDHVGDLLGYQGGVAAGPVVDYEIYLDLILYGFSRNSNGVLDHLRIQHAIDFRGGPRKAN